jgi:hypothetical protein
MKYLYLISSLTLLVSCNSPRQKQNKAISEDGVLKVKSLDSDISDTEFVYTPTDTGDFKALMKVIPRGGRFNDSGQIIICPLKAYLYHLK